MLLIVPHIFDMYIFMIRDRNQMFTVFFQKSDTLLRVHTVHFLLPKISLSPHLSIPNDKTFPFDQLKQIPFPYTGSPHSLLKKGHEAPLEKIMSFNGRSCPSPSKSIDTTPWLVPKRLCVCVYGTLTDGEQ